MATKDKGKKRKQSNREFMEKRTEEKRKTRSSHSASSSATRRSGLAVPAKKMEQMSSDVLRTIVATGAPGAHLAQQVLDKRTAQAEQHRALQQAPAQA